ncbi:DUF4393 domain-containing protein [Cytobacillus horneckiae]|uniref:DUF4393 domain-containing protein n=1 Tax=Cytobacillus horneckiae TaxID=549687 RepID=UPI0034CE1AE2
MNEFNLFPKFIDKAASPVAERVGETLSSVWDIVFGNIDFYAQRKNYERQLSFESFKNMVDEKASSISSDKLQEPELYIIGPTLEASKYYFENDVLRELFANLIASSINTDFQTYTHPSFVDIIKQLSPLDANVLRSFNNVSNHPIVNIHRIIGSRGFILHKNIYLKEGLCDDLPQISMSLTNLQRLGLVSTNYTNSFEDFEYNHFREHKEYKSLKEHAMLSNATFEFNDDLPKDILESMPGLDNQDVILEKGIVDLTSLGSSFLKVCIESK